MGERKTVLVLEDGDDSIEESIERLRADGWRILTTTRPYEVSFLTASRPIDAVVLREPLVPDEEFLRQLRSVDSHPFVLLLQDGQEEPGRWADLVDEWLADPHAHSELVEALESGLGLVHRPGVHTAPMVGTPEDAPVIHRVVDCCRVLSELERERERLLTEALSMILEVTGSERGSLMLGDEKGKSLQLVRRIGFPEDGPEDVTVQVGQDISGSVYARGEPLLVEVDARFSDRRGRGYEGRSFLIVPIRSAMDTVGVINLTNRRDGGVFDQDDLVHASMIASQLAVTLRNSKILEDLHAMTVIDPLTKLYNRRHFDNELKKEIERARRYKRKLTLALLDIDKFKKFNDERGYKNGDQILEHAGQVLRESFREVDVVTRWGGDEFAILLPETDRPDADDHAGFVRRLRDALRSSDLPASVTAPEGLTMSIGIATYPDDCRSESELFRAANRALQRAKKSGGDRCCFAEED